MCNLFKKYIFHWGIIGIHSCKVYKYGLEYIKEMKHWNSLTSNQFVCWEDDGNKSLE
jgi:hypothetical protein